MSFFDQTLTVYKWSQIENTAKFQYEEQEGTYDCSIQPVNPEEAQMIAGQVGNVFNCYVSVDCPAEIGDKVQINATAYKVRGVSEFNYGTLAHKKLILVKADVTSSESS